MLRFWLVTVSWWNAAWICENFEIFDGGVPRGYARIDKGLMALCNETTRSNNIGFILLISLHSILISAILISEAFVQCSIEI